MGSPRAASSRLSGAKPFPVHLVLLENWHLRPLESGELFLFQAVRDRNDFPPPKSRIFQRRPLQGGGCWRKGEDGAVGTQPHEWLLLQEHLLTELCRLLS